MMYALDTVTMIVLRADYYFALRNALALNGESRFYLTVPDTVGTNVTLLKFSICDTSTT